MTGWELFGGQRENGSGVLRGSEHCEGSRLFETVRPDVSSRPSTISWKFGIILSCFQLFMCIGEVGECSQVLCNNSFGVPLLY